MEKSLHNVQGLLKIKVCRGLNLAVRDTRSSDPYAVVSMAEQKLKTRVVKNNCNPQWDEVLTLALEDPSIPIKLTVYDKDTLTGDDSMGEAEIDVKPFLKWVKEPLGDLPNGTTIARVQPNRVNCLAEESRIIWTNGKKVQEMCLRLKNVECGEVVIELEWVEMAGSKKF